MDVKNKTRKWRKNIFSLILKVAQNCKKKKIANNLLNFTKLHKSTQNPRELHKITQNSIEPHKITQNPKEVHKITQKLHRAAQN